MAKTETVEEKILKILYELLSFEEIYACMVVKKNLEGIIPPQEKFNKKIIPIWEILQETMEHFFIIIEQYSKYGYGLSEIYFRVLDYDVIFFILPETDTALVAIVPIFENRGLIEIILEKTRRKILNVLA